MRVDLTGAAGMWSDFNQANKSAMMKSELISWPVTLAILVLAFGSLVAAGLPLMLTIAGLVAAAGSLWIGTRIADISIWSMNFALMFALALGIDYALFIVYRFRGAFFGSKLSAAGGGRGDDGHRRQGRALLGRDGADLAERRDARAESGVPVDEPRDHAVGRLRAGGGADAPAGRAGEARAAAWTGSRSRGSTRASTTRRAPRRGPSGSGAGRCRYGLAALALLVALALPVLSLKTAMPSIKVVPSGDNSRQGYDAVQKAFGPGATGPLQIVAPRAEAAQAAAAARRDPGIARVMPPQPGARRHGARAGDPDDGPVGRRRPARRSTVCARRCRRRRSSAVRWRRTTTSRRRCRPRRRW